MARPNLDQMVRAGELSAFGIVIDPSQNIQTTSTLFITVKLISQGVARQIQIPIGFTKSL
jgi:hypothetical protein